MPEAAAAPTTTAPRPTARAARVNSDSSRVAASPSVAERPRTPSTTGASRAVDGERRQASAAIASPSAAPARAVGRLREGPGEREAGAAAKAVIATILRQGG